MGAGGIALAAIRLATDRRPTESALLGGELGILALLVGVAVTGLFLLGLRDTAAMSTLLAVHLGAVLAFFLLIPYSRMTHGLYRGLALLKARAEVGRRAQPATSASPQTAPETARRPGYVTVLASSRRRNPGRT